MRRQNEKRFRVNMKKRLFLILLAGCLFIGLFSLIRTASSHKQPERPTLQITLEEGSVGKVCFLESNGESHWIYRETAPELVSEVIALLNGEYRAVAYWPRGMVSGPGASIQCWDAQGDSLGEYFLMPYEDNSFTVIAGEWRYQHQTPDNLQKLIDIFLNDPSILSDASASQALAARPIL